jgi:LysM repeat protein
MANGGGLLAASVLGLTLRFGAPGMRADVRSSINPDSAPLGLLSGEATRPAKTSLPSEKKKVLPMDQHPAKKQGLDADPVVHVVQTNETLSGISVEYLGRYDDQVLREVQKHNTDLKDPDVLRVGQKVLLPAVSTDKNSSEKKASESIEGKP